MAQFKYFTLRHAPTIQITMTLATARIYCTKSLPLSGAMVENCSIVRVQQLQMLCHRRCLCQRHTQGMFGSLWNV